MEENTGAEAACSRCCSRCWLGARGNVLQLSQVASGVFSMGRNPSSAFTAEKLLGKAHFRVAVQTVFPVATNNRGPQGGSARPSPRLFVGATCFFPIDYHLSLPPITCSASFMQTFPFAQPHGVCVHQHILCVVFIHPCILRTRAYIHTNLYVHVF